VSLAAAHLLLGLVSPQAAVVHPQDTLVDVGGHRLHLVVHRGTKPLTIVMEAGGGASLNAWAGLDSVLARRTGATVVAYDRAGFGRSDTGPMDLTPQQQVRQLDRALERLRAPRFRIVVGHSYGGMMAVVHAHLLPDRVRGLVLVDPMNARFVRATGNFVYSTVSRVTLPATSRDSALYRMIEGFDELLGSPEASDGDLRMPMVVVSAGEAWWGRPEVDREWRTAHQAIASAAPDRRLVLAAGTRHDIPEQSPESVVGAVESLLAPR
jgi:pimeloyl-ACP methyl ester carboxylesterase